MRSLGALRQPRDDTPLFLRGHKEKGALLLLLVLALVLVLDLLAFEHEHENEEDEEREREALGQQPDRRLMASRP